MPIVSELCHSMPQDTGHPDWQSLGAIASVYLTTLRKNVHIWGAEESGVLDNFHRGVEAGEEKEAGKHF